MLGEIGMGRGSHEPADQCMYSGPSGQQVADTGCPRDTASSRYVIDDNSQPSVLDTVHCIEQRIMMNTSGPKRSRLDHQQPLSSDQCMGGDPTNEPEQTCDQAKNMALSKDRIRSGEVPPNSQTLNRQPLSSDQCMSSDDGGLGGGRGGVCSTSQQAKTRVQL